MASAAGDLAEVIFQKTVASQTTENTFGFENKAGTGTLSSLASDFTTALIKNTSGGLLYTCHTSVSSGELIVRDVKPATGAAVQTTPGAVIGTNNTADLLPPQCAGVLSFSTGLAGRSYRGRLYFAGLTEADQAAGTWTAGAVSNMNTIITNLLTVFGPTGSNPDWQWVVISRYLNKSLRPTPIGTAITAGSVRPYVYTQRRRTIGYGQ